MYKNVLENIDNISLWPVISFVIFFLFFLGLLWWVFSVDKKFIADMSNMPLGDETDSHQVTSPEKRAPSPPEVSGWRGAGGEVIMKSTTKNQKV